MKTALAALAAALLGACGDDQVAARCPELDPGACPASAGGSCDDPACRAILACVDGAWQLRATCAPADAGADAVTDAPLRDASSACGDAAEVPVAACAPELELPDCPDSVLRACPASACASGCEAFFACGDGGWEPLPVATCEADGTLVVHDGG